MTPGPRPASVRRFLRRPLWWAAAAFLLSAGLVLVDVNEVHRQRRSLRSALPVEGLVSRRYRGGPEVTLSYDNPVTGQRLQVEAYVWHDRLYPRPGQPVRVLVDRGDPEQVVLAGDHFPYDANLWWYVPLVLTGLAIAAKRRLHLLQVERVINAEEPSFAMVGVVVPPRRFARRCELHLYPLDAAPGSSPLCAVPLLSTAGAPIGRPAFPVEVKGSPRAMGLVVARLGPRAPGREVGVDVGVGVGGGMPSPDPGGAGVLWPAGRALLSASVPRPPEIAAPVELPAASAPAAPRAGPSRWWRGAAVELAALAAAVAVAASVAVTTLGHAAQSRRHDQWAVTVIAEVRGVNEAEGRVSVSYTDPRTGSAMEGTAPAAFPADYRVGRRFPARVAPDAPGRLRFVREPYEVGEPLVWGTLPVAVPGILLGRRWRWAREARRVARGPWCRAHAWPMAQSGRHSQIGLTPPGTPHLLCVVRIPASEHHELFRRPPPALLKVAGTPEPGAPVVVAVDDRLLPAGPAVAPARGATDLRG